MRMKNQTILHGQNKNLVWLVTVRLFQTTRWTTVDDVKQILNFEDFFFFLHKKLFKFNSSFEARLQIPKQNSRFFFFFQLSKLLKAWFCTQTEEKQTSSLLSVFRFSASAPTSRAFFYN